MNLSNFILLRDEEKKMFLLHDGILVAKRTNYECIVFLFQVNTFYVEAFCNLENKNVQEYRAFESTNALNPYLESIPLDDLLS
jgi:hypothetical protein